MSFNLYACTSSTEIKLWQTPTGVTLAICVNDKGELGQSLHGKDARRALHAYIVWVENRGGVFETAAEAQAQRDLTLEHTKYVRKFLNRPGLEVYFV